MKCAAQGCSAPPAAEPLYLVVGRRISGERASRAPARRQPAPEGSRSAARDCFPARRSRDSPHCPAGPCTSRVAASNRAPSTSAWRPSTSRRNVCVNVAVRSGLSPVAMPSTAPGGAHHGNTRLANVRPHHPGGLFVTNALQRGRRRTGGRGRDPGDARRSTGSGRWRSGTPMGGHRRYRPHPRGARLPAGLSLAAGRPPGGRPLNHRGNPWARPARGRAPGAACPEAQGRPPLRPAPQGPPAAPRAGSAAPGPPPGSGGRP